MIRQRINDGPVAVRSLFDGRDHTADQSPVKLLTVKPATTTTTIGADDWKLWQVAQRLSRRTINERLRVIRQLHEETGIQPIDIAAIDIVEWVAEHDGDWSDSTAATYSSYLASWFKWLQLVDR